MRDCKIVFTGTPGAGKTTAIAAISDTPPVVTDVPNRDPSLAKARTTTFPFSSKVLGVTTTTLEDAPGWENLVKCQEVRVYMAKCPHCGGLRQGWRPHGLAYRAARPGGACAADRCWQPLYRLWH